MTREMSLPGYEHEDDQADDDHLSGWDREWWATVEERPQTADSEQLAALRVDLLIGDAIKSIPAPESIVAGMLDLNSLAAIYGPPASYKSFTALDLAACVASGTWWHGREVRKGTVLYIAAEGVAGMGQRLEAWQTQQGHYGPIEGLIWLPRPVNLRAPLWSLALIQLVAELEPVLVIIDTLARSMIGSDENSSRDMGEVVEVADRLRRACGACVLIVHHVGKTEGAGLRGHSSLLGALDTAIEAKAAEQVVVLEVTKAKNHEPGRPIRLKMQPTADSLVPVAYGGDEPLGDMLPAHAVTMLQALADVDTGSGLATTIWFEMVAPTVPRRTFMRWRKRLLDAGLCQSGAKNGKGPFMLTEQGIHTLGANSASEVPPEVPPDRCQVPPSARGFSPGTTGTSDTRTSQEMF